MEINTYQNAICQFNDAAKFINLDPDVCKILSRPNNEIIVNFPVKLDDGRVEMFTGYRVQHNNTLGPYKGGLRFHPAVDLEEIRSLATWLTWKSAIAHIPFGGAYGGVQFDPQNYTPEEVEGITRRFAFALGSNIGPEYDIPAPDVNTSPQTMAWILDTYLSTVPPLERNRAVHVVTGKPVQLGGSQGREKASGQGVVFAIQEWAQDQGFDLGDATYALQGFGNVGTWTARLMGEAGAKLIAIQDTTGAIANPAGIDADDLLAYDAAHGGVVGYPQAQPIDRQTFFSTSADIFIPAARENQITAETAPWLQVRLVAEAANGPTTLEGGRILQQRGIEQLPDLLCSAGGLIVSYFEWLQNKRSEFWSLEEVDARLHKTMRAAYQRVRQAALDFETDWRTAAYAVALWRLEKVYKERGIFP